jgi:uncharacterized damage-inducible protein DinB
MISVETSIRHLAWSNQLFFSYFVSQPLDVFALRAADGEWTVGQLLSHIANSGSWFRYCLQGEDWSDYEAITNGTMIKDFLKILTELDSVLLSEVSKPDEELVIEAGDEVIHATRSLILSQAAMHAAEHKGQIATILKQNGHHIDLDELDVWKFVATTKEH